MCSFSNDISCVPMFHWHPQRRILTVTKPTCPPLAILTTYDSSCGCQVLYRMMTYHYHSWPSKLKAFPKNGTVLETYIRQTVTVKGTFWHHCFVGDSLASVGCEFFQLHAHVVNDTVISIYNSISFWPKNGGNTGYQSMYVCMYVHNNPQQIEK